MTVKELRDMLADHDDDLDVVVDVFGKTTVPVVGVELVLDDGNDETGHLQINMED